MDTTKRVYIELMINLFRKNNLWADDSSALFLVTPLLIKMQDENISWLEAIEKFDGRCSIDFHYRLMNLAIKIKRCPDRYPEFIFEKPL